MNRGAPRSPPPTAPLPPVPQSPAANRPHGGSNADANYVTYAGAHEAAAARSVRAAHQATVAEAPLRRSSDTIRPETLTLRPVSVERGLSQTQTSTGLGLSAHLDEQGRACVNVVTDSGQPVLDVAIALRTSLEDLAIAGRRHPNFRERRP